MARNATKLTSIYEKVEELRALSVLHQMIEASDLFEPLTDEGPYTLFAPSNEAFSRLPDGLVDELLKPKNLAKLLEVLNAHLIPEKYPSQELDGKKLPTATGMLVKVGTKNGKIEFEGAKVIERDIECSNGVIHIIDEVIIPR